MLLLLQYFLSLSKSLLQELEGLMPEELARHFASVDSLLAGFRPDSISSLISGNAVLSCEVLTT